MVVVALTGLSLTFLRPLQPQLVFLQTSVDNSLSPLRYVLYRDYYCP